MNIVLKGKKGPIDIEYFGHQGRFYKFFNDVISPLMSEDGIYAETNSGSINNIFRFAENYKVIVNDAGEYSNSVAKAILTDDVPHFDDINCSAADWLKDYADSYIKRAAVFSAIVKLYGYNATIPKELTEELEHKINYYIQHFKHLSKFNRRALAVFNDDLFTYLDKLYTSQTKIDVMFMDFAWPWREQGEKTEEYETTANGLTNIFHKVRETPIEIWDKTNVLDRVYSAIMKAKKVSKYVLLSNQSSNYPDPETLEVMLAEKGIKYLERHTMTTQAEYEDNLGRKDFFREYLYVIPGDLFLGSDDYYGM